MIYNSSNFHHNSGERLNASLFEALGLISTLKIKKILKRITYEQDLFINRIF